MTDDDDYRAERTAAGLLAFGLYGIAEAAWIG
jgi:hypothetical protein